MPKTARAVRTTTNPFGQKFLRVMRDKGIDQDFAAAAAAFGVKVPSVYDWVDHGRFAKIRFARLVEWSGRSLNWWFDVPESVGANEPPRATGSAYAAPPPGLNSAQRDVLMAFDRLPRSRQRIVREELMRDAARFMADVQDFQHRAGVTGVVDPARAAEALPLRPDGEQPDSVPGALEQGHKTWR